MAGNIKGLTVEIGGDTTKLGKALESVQKKSKGLSGELGQINKLLKMDPGNADLLAQKQKVLADAVANTREKLETLKKANEKATKSAENYDAWKAKYDPIQAEIDELTQKLKKLKAEQAEVADTEGVESGAYQEMQAEVKTLTASLKTLKKQAAAVTEEFGNPASPEQLRELQREVVATSSKLKSYEKAAEETAQAVEKLGKESSGAGQDLDETGDEAKKSGKSVDDFGDAAKKAEKSSGNLGQTLGTAVKTGLAAVGAVCAAAVTGLVAAAEGTREYRTEMGKLDAAFTASGHSSKVASAAYSTLYGVIGETDQSVEAAQQIALLAKSEEDVTKWSGLAAGVVGRFGDALQPETFFEAANETLKLGESTGAYTQMLEGCGINVEDFNKKLAKCKTTEEKQAYMLQVTEGALGKAGEAYKKNNAEIIRANQANDQWMQSLSGVGGAIEPIVTDVKLLGASLLADAVPGVQKLAEAFRGLMSGDAGASGDFAAALSGLVTGLVNKITQALPTIAQTGLSIITTLATSLIQQLPTLLSTAGQIIPQLVTALAQQIPTLLTTGGQVISKLLAGIVSNAPRLLQGAVNGLGSFVQGVQTYLPIVVSKGAELLGKLGEGIKNSMPGLLSQGLDIVMNLATSLYNAAPGLIDAGFGFIKNLVQGLMNSLPTLLSKVPEIVSKFANILNDNVPRILKHGMDLVLTIAKGIIKAIPALVANIPKIIQAIVDVWQAFNWINLGKKAITLLKNGITNMVGAVKGAGTKIMNAITNALKALPGKLRTLGKNAITFLKNAITSARSAVASSAHGIFSAIVNAITSLPSKLLSLGKQAITKLGSAISSGVSTVKSKALSLVSSVVAAVKTLPGKVLSVGKDMVKGIWAGISGATGWIKSKISGWVGDVTSFLKGLFGIESPSKVMRDEIGRHLPTGIAAGVEKTASAATGAMAALSQDMLTAADPDVGGLSFERNLSSRPVRIGSAYGVAAAAFGADNAALLAKLDGIYERLGRLQVVLDSGATVGGLIDKIDAGLATRQALHARGV